MSRVFLLVFSLLPAMAWAHPDPWAPGQPCPVDIHTLVPQSGAFPTMKGVHEALLTCPDIKSLHLRVAGLGCSEWPDRWSFPLSLLSADKYLPSLESLSLEGYRFEDKEWGLVGHLVDGPSLPSFEKVNFDQEYWTIYLSESLESWFNIWSWRLSDPLRWYKHTQLSVAEREQSNLDLLLQSMDFSQVRDLAVKDTCWNAPEDAGLLRWAEALPSIQSLAVSGSWDCRFRETKNDEGVSAPSHVPSFIAALPSTGLTNLTWVNGGTCAPDVLDSVLNRHGPSLTALEWRHDEFTWKNRPVFTTEALKALGNRAPNLQSLTIDLNQDDTWPTDELEAIARGMPNLTDLTVYLRLASDLGWAANNASYHRYNYDLMKQYEATYGGKDLHPPLRLRTVHAKNLFKTLQASKAGDSLKTVQFRVGDWTRPWDGPMTIGNGIFEQTREWYICSKLRDDGTPKGNGEDVCEYHKIDEDWW